jgi:hypothetical protein
VCRYGLDSPPSDHGPLTGSSGHVDIPSGCVNGKEFLEKPSDCCMCFGSVVSVVHIHSGFAVEQTAALAQEPLRIRTAVSMTLPQFTHSFIHYPPQLPSPLWESLL